MVFVYKDHYKRHEAEARSCGCNQEFKSLKEKSFHLSTVHDGLYGCIKCKAILKSEEQLQKHMLLHEMVFDCNQCDFKVKANRIKPSGAKYSLKLHVDQVHRLKEVEPQQIYICKICEEDGSTKHFVKPSKLKVHMDKVHTPKSCPLCGVTVKVLELHMANIHKSDEEKQFRCSDCGRGFNTKGLLETHAWSQHSGVLLTCRSPGCERVYKDVSNRSAHERKIHGRTLGAHRDERRELTLL